MKAVARVSIRAGCLVGLAVGIAWNALYSTADLLHAGISRKALVWPCA